MGNKHILLLIILLIIFINIKFINPFNLLELDNPEASEQIISRGANFDVFKDNQGKFKSVIFSSPVNIKYNGDFIPLEDFLNITEKKGTLQINDLNGHSCFINLNYTLVNSFETAISSFNITKKRGGYYFTSYVDKEVKDMKYLIDCPNLNLDYNLEEEDLYLGDIKIDFTEAKEKQNITTIFDNKSKSLEFKISDSKTGSLGLIDPTITYNFSNSQPLGEILQWDRNFYGTSDIVFPPKNLTHTGTTQDLTGDSDFDFIDGIYDDFAVYQNKPGGHRFRFNLSNIISSNNQVKIINWTLVVSDNGISDIPSCEVYLWDNVLNTWVSSNNFDNIFSSFNSVYAYNNTKALDYVNSTNLYTYSFFMCQTSSPSQYNPRTDFVKLEVTFDGLIINTPRDHDKNLTGLNLTLNVSTSGYNNTIWYTTNGGRINKTICASLGNCAENQTIITFPRNNSYNLTVYANNSINEVIQKSIINLTIGTSFNNILPNITILMNDSYNTTTTNNINIYFNISDDDDWVYNATLYLNGIINQSMINPKLNSPLNFTLDSVAEGLHNYFINVIDSNLNSSNSSTFTFRIDKTPPLLNIQIPFNFEEFDYNVSIPLNYTVTDLGVGVNTSSCFAILDETILITLNLCLNSSINVSEGTHTIRFYASDTLNNAQNVNRTFIVSLNAPAINLDYPLNNSFFNYKNNIYFNWTTTDPNGISGCSIWHSLNGSFSLNKTRTNIDSGVQAFELFNVTSDGSYFWNVNCTDTTGSGRFSQNNFSFVIDTLKPNITNITIYTTPGSQTIKFNFSVSDLYLNSCKYSITNSSGGYDIQNTSLLNCGVNNTQVVVSDFSTYTLHITANDLAGNENTLSKNFSVNQITGGESGGGGSGLSDNPKLSAVAIKPPPNITKTFSISQTYSDLERAIIYARINEFCGNKLKKPELSIIDNSENCLLSNTELDLILIDLKNNKIELTRDELFLWYLQYKQSNIENVLLFSDQIRQFNLVQAIVGNLVPLILNPPSIDKYFIKDLNKNNVISYPIISNKKLKSCEVISDDKNFFCELFSESSIKVYYNITNTDFISQVFQGKISVLTDDEPSKQESKQVNVVFRVLNYKKIPLTLFGIIGLFSLIIIFILIKNKNGKKIKVEDLLP